jgi:hypothetical protein
MINKISLYAADSYNNIYVVNKFYLFTQTQPTFFSGIQEGKLLKALYQLYIYIYTHIYICVCVCVCVLEISHNKKCC